MNTDKLTSKFNASSLKHKSFKWCLVLIAGFQLSISHASLNTYIAIQRMYLEDQARGNRDAAEAQRRYLESNPEALCTTPYAQSRMAYEQCVAASKIYRCQQSPSKSTRAC